MNVLVGEFTRNQKEHCIFVMSSYSAAVGVEQDTTSTKRKQRVCVIKATRFRCQAVRSAGEKTSFGGEGRGHYKYTPQCVLRTRDTGSVTPHAILQKEIVTVHMSRRGIVILMTSSKNAQPQHSSSLKL